MRVLNLFSDCNTGGIEVLYKNIIESNEIDNRICCLFGEGILFNEIKKYHDDKIFSLKKFNKNLNKIVNEIEKYCKKEKIDIIVIHHEGIRCNLVYIKLQKKLKNVKFVRYFHSSYDKYYLGDDKNLLEKIVAKYYMKKMMRYSDLLIFISKFVESSFVTKFRVDNEKCIVIYNGIGNEFYSKNVDKKRENKIAFVGRLTKVKGVDLLIDAFNIVKQKGMDVTLTIVGEGEEKQELIEKVCNYGLENNVIFTGRQSDVIQYLDNADIFVYPSICEEGFGISVVEAMARGCIPITFNKGGLPEIIKNEKNGFIVNDVTAESLADEIIKVINLNNKDEIRKNAIETAKKFNITNTIKEIKSSYSELLN